MEIDSKNLKKNNRVSAKYLALKILGIIFVSFNLRAPITSIGPILIGFLFDLTNSWNSTIIILIIAILFLIFCGIKAGKDEVTFA